MQDAAMQEALDEAGLAGSIIGGPLSQYVFKKRGRHHEVLVYLMEVSTCNGDWKESHERLRQWAVLKDARDLIDRPHLFQILLMAATRIANLGRTANIVSNGPPALFPTLQIDASSSKADTNPVISNRDD
jgi:hypothetical protein